MNRPPTPAAPSMHTGLIQPITVRLDNQGFEIVAGARRFRAAQLAELFSVSARIVDIDDAKAIEWQLVENSQLVDVQPLLGCRLFQTAPGAYLYGVRILGRLCPQPLIDKFG